MASGIVTSHGLRTIGRIASQISPVPTVISCATVDDSITNIASNTIQLNSNGATVTNFFSKNFDATPTRSGQTIKHLITFGITNALFIFKRICLHNEDSSLVTASISV